MTGSIFAKKTDDWTFTVPSPVSIPMLFRPPGLAVWAVLMMSCFCRLSEAAQVSANQVPADSETPAIEPEQDPYVVVLGIAQDGGFPQTGCQRTCCQKAWNNVELRRNISCVAVVDPATGQRWMLDCTPDFKQQLFNLDQIQKREPKQFLNGILLTHAHMGHYTGLMHLGREAVGADGVPVYAMPRMKQFLESNGPWDQLVKLKNIQLLELEGDAPIDLSESIQVTPILVPHRDEYSETVAFLIEGPNQTVLYLPDIDKWSRWDRSIEDLIGRVDVALLDGTFFDPAEIPGRNLDEIPHPLVSESLAQFAAMDAETRDRIHFIHLNHTNPLLQADSQQRRIVEQSGMHVASELQIIKL